MFIRHHAPRNVSGETDLHQLADLERFVIDQIFQRTERAELVHYVEVVVVQRTSQTEHYVWVAQLTGNT